ncbi:MAG: NAD(P)-dependent glycerol-3-phosphate dehydrogenase [Ignavibacteriae bacterium]|nr:MAG: NAD(P)-dependent glycerol-3-phosphate dehydrogenase [Ignavibacteriota bacterium]
MHIGVIGAGAWGTALAHVAERAGHASIIWARESEVVAEINSSHHNERFLPGAHLGPNITATSDLNDLRGCDLVVNATPTQFVRATLTPAVGPDSPLANIPFVNVAKGIELGTHKRVSEVVAEVLPNSGTFAVLSGPSHAEEVIKDMPTTVVCASADHVVATLVQSIFKTKTFRVYTSDDVVGVEICGSLKNVIAIAAGIVDGSGLGDNTKAALMTRGLAEIARLGVALGADKDTFFGLAGMGDLIVTCDSKHSRNRFVGDQIGKGRTLDEILGSMSAIAEGVPTTRAALELAASVGVELPITEKVASILFDHEEPMKAIRDLMVRPLKPE